MQVYLEAILIYAKVLLTVKKHLLINKLAAGLVVARVMFI